ncbi:MAG: TolC family protein [Planctomycetales bacterium]|nr:TolC family protein [Planctomycetales bacterium]MBN8625870.1 TolC family protein [Planctomycetota bacterium]
MSRRCRFVVTWLVVGALVAPSPGCGTRGRFAEEVRSTYSAYRSSATNIEYADVRTPTSDDLLTTPAPRSLAAGDPVAFRDISLQEAMQHALANAKVLRDLGGQMLRAPQTYSTVYGAAIQETDPRFGVEAALSAFDASFSSSAFYEKNDRALNNQFFGGGTRLLQQDALVLQNQLTKRAAGGTQLSVRSFTDYDANNAPGNAFPSAWNQNIETEFRHPLLQGGGVDFNRIAGPGATAGVYNGVLIARINTDVSLAELETGVRGLLSEVENAYWDLYYAYRDLDAKVAARNTALETWRKVHSLYDTGRRGGEAEKEAQSREQYFRFEEEVQNALAGQPLDGTRMNNGSSGGTFRGNGGVQVCERRLRLLIGLPIGDGEFLRPADEPSVVPVKFDWQPLIAESLARRVELRRQRWIVKRRELELAAARNFLLPQLDTVGRYRWRGFGDDWMGGPDMRFGDAVGTLFGGDFQEWQLGAEFTMPLGFRRGHAAVKSAQWQLARERSLLHEMERQVVHDLSTAVAEAERSLIVVQTAANRRGAAGQQVNATQAAFDADQATLDYLLEAQRGAADADIRFHRARVEHALALKNVQFEAGTLLQYNGVDMAEGPWADKAYLDSAQNARSLLRSGPINYILSPGRKLTGQEMALLPQLVEEPVPQPMPQALPPQQQPPSAPVIDQASAQQPLPPHPQSSRPAASVNPATPPQPIIHPAAPTTPPVDELH